MAASLFSVRRFLIIFSIAWVILIVDHAILFTLLDWSWQVSLIDSLVSNGLLLAFCLITLNSFRYYMPGMNQYLGIVGICLLFTVFWLFLSRFLLTMILGDVPGYNIFLTRSLMIRSSIAFLVLGMVILIAMIWFNWQELQKNESRKADAEKLSKEAELFKLRQQLQPHFLFNSLNSINALIGSRPQEARKMVQQLSDFLRGTIKKEETQWVTLQEEMQYLQLYLDIEKVRFGNRLSTNIESSEASLQMKLPALLLQPIVENAIKFGLYDTTGDTIIDIKTSVVDNELRVQVCNPFDPETSSPQKGTGFGLKSVHRRLYLLFARTDLVLTEVKDDKFTTIVKIPGHPTSKNE